MSKTKTKPKLKTKPKSKLKPKLTTKSRSKTKPRVTRKPLKNPKVDITVAELESLPDIEPANKPVEPPTRHRKYWWLIALTIPLIVLIWYLSQTWLVQASVSQAKTYPQVSVFGINVGGLSTSNLNSQLGRIKSEFESKKITLVNAKRKWVFDSNKIGVTFNVQATSQAVLHLNKLSIIDKYRLLTGGISSAVAPTISIDNSTCVKSLAVIPVVQVESKDAIVYFDQELKIKPDEPSTRFSAVLTCKALSKELATGSSAFKVSLATIPANLTQANLKPKLSQIQSIVSKPLVLKSGAYQQTLTSKQLLDLLEISKKGNDVKVDWSSAKLDNLVNDIADKVDTNNSSPALGACQYLINSGGNWLDKTATKNYITSLGTGSSRTYTLPIVYHAPSIGKRTPVGYGSSGTVYLTFDDGMTYANQIMDYASCYGVKVTFFEIGERVGTDATALHRAIAEGHAVQSHGHYHAMYDYGDRSYDWQYNDISQSITDIMSVTGVRPTYFRPPGGNRTANTYNAASANGLKLILWGDSSADATVGGISSSQTCANVLAGVFPGASVLMHSVKASTAAAVPCIIEGLAARGYNMQALR